MNCVELIAETVDVLEQLEKEQKPVQFQKRISFLKARQPQNEWNLSRTGGIDAVLRKPERCG